MNKLRCAGVSRRDQRAYCIAAVLLLTLDSKRNGQLNGQLKDVSRRDQWCM